MMQTEAYWENLVKRSLCRFLLLGELAKGPVHGYGLNLAIRNACQGCCEPTEAMVYSTTKKNTRGAAAAFAGSLLRVTKRFAPPAGCGRRCCQP